MKVLAKFEHLKLSKSEQKNVGGGASAARCNRMIERWVRRGAGDSRLGTRIDKNC